MNTCDSCRFWVLHKERHVPEGHKLCSCPKFKYTDDVEDIHHQDDTVSYWDMDGYFAEFETGPKFGCVHYEQGN